MDRVCRTRDWKVRRAARTGGAPLTPAGVVTGPLFQGTVYLADISFVIGGKSLSVPQGDLATVGQYVGQACGSISAYASQYGDAALRPGPLLPTFTTPALGGGYSDADLQGWIATIVQANALPPGAAVLVLNPPGAVNTDAKESGGIGVLGYHGAASRPYSFVNLLGSNFTVDDRRNLFAEAVSHELAEMTVDPLANDSNPEVCDGCGTNCRGSGPYRAYFDAAGRYLSSGSQFPPAFDYAYFVSAIARPSNAADCPAPSSACAYPPPGPGSA